MKSEHAGSHVATEARPGIQTTNKFSVTSFGFCFDLDIRKYLPYLFRHVGNGAVGVNLSQAPHVTARQLCKLHDHVQH